MLGYGKDSHTYRVFNLFHHKVVETVDVRFDETNGSQREHLPLVLDEISPSEAIMHMGTREIIPNEDDGLEEIVLPTPPTPPEDNAGPEDNAEDNDQQPQNLQPLHPRVANEVQIEKMISNINVPGPLARSRASQLANFYGHFSFVSINQPTKVDEAFKETEWIQAMQEEFHQFELNNVWELVKRPDPRKHNIIAPSGSTATNKMNLVKSLETKLVLLLKVTRK